MSLSYRDLDNTRNFDRPLLKIAADLHHFTEPDALVEYALTALLDCLEAHAGSFFIWDEFKKQFVLKSARGLQSAQIEDVQVRLREGIMGHIGERGEPILVKDILSDNRFNQYKRMGQYQSASFISIPLLAHNKLIGVLNITERFDRRPFSEDEFLIAQIFSRHVAAAYENLRHQENLRRDNEELHLSLQRVKRDLQERESLAHIGKLATNLAHELNNPLDGIRRYVNLALDQVMEDSLAREYLLKAKKGIRRAIHVIRGLLQFAREIHGREATTIEMHTLLEEFIESVSHDPKFRDIKIQKEFCPGAALVTDRGLHIVFRNLFQNAVQAMNGQGTITFSTCRDNGAIVVLFDDAGCGIPVHAEARIFEPFYTTKSYGEGTGMGLAICRQIIEQCGGLITCENLPEKGARFTLTIPCRNGVPAAR